MQTTGLQFCVLNYTWMRVKRSIPKYARGPAARSGALPVSIVVTCSLIVVRLSYSPFRSQLCPVVPIRRKGGKPVAGIFGTMRDNSAGNATRDYLEKIAALGLLASGPLEGLPFSCEEYFP